MPFAMRKHPRAVNPNSKIHNMNLTHWNDLSISQQQSIVDVYSKAWESIEITKISPISGQEITTGWNQSANDPSTNAVMIATALTSAESWMVLFPSLMTKLQAEWKKRKKSKQ